MIVRDYILVEVLVKDATAIAPPLSVRKDREIPVPAGPARPMLHLDATSGEECVHLVQRGEQLVRIDARALVHQVKGSSCRVEDNHRLEGETHIDHIACLEVRPRRTRSEASLP